MRYKPNRRGDGVPGLPTKANPRVLLLAPLFLQVRDVNGNYVSHTKKEWRELAAQLAAKRAFATAKVCGERMKKA